MRTYDVEFGKKLSEAALMVVADGIESLEAQRAVLYLSLLSTEISLKAMLEKAGKPVPEIRARSHRLSELLADLDDCEVEVEVTPRHKEFDSAARLRSVALEHIGRECTVGQIVDEQNQGVSRYPNEIRYGDRLNHYPAQVVAQMASVVSEFALQHWDSLRIRR